ncbi:MAG: sodium:proton exchanger [Proteobacteria bacterium]|nr:MAG: sodium:proton exchanger [Pseudomonadota bacterium]
MDGHSLLTDVAFAIVGASVLGIPAYIFRMPLVLAFLIAGMLLGPSLGFGIIRNPDSIQTLSEIGLILLMFILGLEIDIRKLLRAGRAVIVNGITQFVGCAILGAAFFAALGFMNRPGDYSLTYLAVATSLSSTLVVVKMLSDRMELDLLTSRITLGILVFQDIWAIVFLAIQPNLQNMQVLPISISLGKAGVLIAASWFLAKYVLPSVFKKIAKQPELVLVTAMGWCFGICGLASYLGLSLEMGALVAGVSIASFPYHLDIASKITSLRDFFVTLFFVALGMQIPLPSWEIIGLAGLMVVFVVASRFLVVFPVLHFMHYGYRGSLVPAINLAQMSEFSLVVIAIGVQFNHIPQSLLSAGTIALVVTLLLASFMIPSGYSIYRFLKPMLEKLGIKDHVMSTESKVNTQAKAIVLFGFYREASSFLEEFVKRHSQALVDQLLVVDYNPETLQKLKERGVPCIYGDIGHPETLRSQSLAEAAVIISTIPDSQLKGTTNLKLLHALRELAPHSRIIVTADTLDKARELYAKGADYVFVPRIVGAHFLVDILERVQGDRMDAVRQGAQKFLSEWKETLP